MLIFVPVCDSHHSHGSGPVFDQSIHFRPGRSRYQSEAPSTPAGSGCDYSDIFALCFTLPPCRNSAMGLQIDFLDRMRQNWCQLKFCCSRWFAWVIVSYLQPGQSSTTGCNLTAKLVCFQRGRRYKRTCFSLMAYAFFNATSCTKCKSPWMYLFFSLFFSSRVASVSCYSCQAIQCKTVHQIKCTIRVFTYVIIAIFAYCMHSTCGVHVLSSFTS